MTTIPSASRHCELLYSNLRKTAILCSIGGGIFFEWFCVSQQVLKFPSLPAFYTKTVENKTHVKSTQILVWIKQRVWKGTQNIPS